MKPQLKGSAGPLESSEHHSHSRLPLPSTSVLDAKRWHRAALRAVCTQRDHSFHPS